VDKSTEQRIRERLYKTHRPDEEGVWRIVGEDANPDMGGHHYQPLLTNVEGAYADAVDMALSLDGFVSWGYGGDIEKVRVVKTSGRLNAYRKQLKEDLRKAEEEVARLKTELGELT
jgi:hypothetical protein